MANPCTSKLWQSIEPNPKQGEKVFNFEKKAVNKLMKIIKDGDESTLVEDIIQVAIDNMVTIDGSLASDAIKKASLLTDDKSSRKVEEAQKEMDKASEEISKGNFDNAINHYKNAWKKAQEALTKQEKEQEKQNDKQEKEQEKEDDK